MSAGQVVGLDDLPTVADVELGVVTEAHAVLARLTAEAPSTSAATSE